MSSSNLRPELELGEAFRRVALVKVGARHWSHISVGACNPEAEPTTSAAEPGIGAGRRCTGTYTATCLVSADEAERERV